MSQIKQLLRLHQQGKGKKFTSRQLGLSKNTVKTYLDKAALSGLRIDDLLALDDPLLEAKLHAGNPTIFYAFPTCAKCLQSIISHRNEVLQ